jgi:TolA-binding protein
MKKIFAITFMAFISTGCFKTAEEIKREKLVDKMSVQLEQSSKLVAQLTQQVDSLQGKMDSTSGQLEEIGFKTSSKQEETQQTFAQTTASLAEQVSALKSDVQKNKATLASINSSLKAQQEYLNKLNKTLASLTGVSSSTKSSSTSRLKQAHKAFEKNQQKKAKELYQEVLTTGKVNAAQRNHIWHNLGLMDYWNKKYDDASVWFSKIYTKYPKSSWAPRSLLYIARSFKKSGKKDEAIATYAQLVKQYPKSKQAKVAKEEMK